MSAPSASPSLSPRLPRLGITALTATTPAGPGRGALLAALRDRRGALAPCDFLDVDLPTWIGRVTDLESVSLPDDLADYDCRNNRLAELGLQQDGFAEAVAAAVQRHGAGRIAVVLGTSTSGILHTELAFRERDPETGALPSPLHYATTHELSSAPRYVRQRLDLKGPVYAVSTACSSSGKVFASAQRLIATGMCDAVVVGGVDSLCLTTLYGFASLELTSTGPCRPGDAARNGISIGEAAGFALVEADRGEAPLCLFGVGESVDAHHMSSPHPEGRGAQLAMRRALDAASLAPASVDYVNLHGTASRVNDAAEDRALEAVFGRGQVCSSTKGWTGHTLGAAGITGLVTGALAIEHGFLPGTLNTEQVDPDFTADYLLGNRDRRPTRVMTNSFGFGGNNCSLLFGRPEENA
ncbi:beta-ketoacyl-[acyl-carrier-protein] synthase family protein [Guyparkeria halophila]|uniref:beta-ketoacyl-[acyl-carrier-protein] synthase family protein n=1 Tax=Guyparkeria halophila TaxID=47960 RepID=UPI003898E92B